MRLIQSLPAIAVILAASPVLAVSIPLNFSGQTFDDTTRIITFEDILGDGTTDLRVVPVDGPASFQSGNDARNETSLGQLGQINLDETTVDLTTNFQFSFVEAGTTTLTNPGGRVEIGVLDLDFNQREAVTLLSRARVTASTTTLVTQDVDPIDGNIRFRGADVSDVPNGGLSNGSGTLSEAQENAAISIDFGNVNTFGLRFGVLAGDVLNSRNFFLDGAIVFDDTTPEVIVNNIPLPAPALLLLSGLVAVAAVSRRRA
ncbi:MAG: hypothetical protein ACFBSD_06725 [Paracoccaceae bacterium]